jgi:GNAT superfamily N-acetyltransferase
MHDINISIDSWHDLDAIAQMHIDYMPSMSKKNKYFKKLLVYHYETVRDHKDNILVTADIKGILMGYVCIIKSLPQIYLTELKKYHLFIVVNILLVSKFNLQSIIRAILMNFTKTTLRRNGESGVRTNSNDILNWELRPIIVSKCYQGTGIAQALVGMAEKSLRERGEKKYFLRVNKDNLRAINFYTKIGMVTVGERNGVLIMAKTLI